MITKKTIGFYSDTNDWGGSEAYLKTIIERIDKERYDVVLFIPTYHQLVSWASGRNEFRIVHTDNRKASTVTTSKESAASNPVKASGPKTRAPLLGLRSLKLILGTFRDIFRLKKIFKQHKVDLIHFNDTGCEPPVIAAKLAGIRTIVGTYHVLPSYDAHKIDTVRRTIEWWSVRCMTKAIAVSKATKEAWIERTGVKEDTIDVIYNGIDLSQFTVLPKSRQRELRLKENLKENSNVVGVPARLHPMKGHEYFIKAIPEIRKHVPLLKVWLIGDGELKDELMRMVAELDLKDTVEFLGHRKDMSAVLSGLDLVVMPSVALETFSIALVEAMACGKPVVASRFSGIPEVVEDKVTGLLVPPKDSEALAQAVVELLIDSEKAEEMGLKGRQRAEALFTQQRMLEETYSFYERVFLPASS